jgi:hypothetical protein
MSRECDVRVLLLTSNTELRLKIGLHTPLGIFKNQLASLAGAAAAAAAAASRLLGWQECLLDLQASSRGTKCCSFWTSAQLKSATGSTLRTSCWTRSWTTGER